MEKLTYTVPELARALNVSESYARRLLTQGHIPAVRLGRRLLVRIDAVDKFLRDKQQWEA